MSLPAIQVPQSPKDPLFPIETRDLSRHVNPLPARVLEARVAQQLASQGRLKPSPAGVVFDEKHLVLVSWDMQGLLFEKSIFQPPRASHSGAVMLRSQIEAHTSRDTGTSYILRQAATVISFLPNSIQGISDHACLLPGAFDDPRGVPGRNWQSLDMLFSPNSFLESPAIRVSASCLVPVTDQLYRAFVLRAHDLDAAQMRYFVLGSQNGKAGVENCIGALKGVSLYLPNAEELPRTFTLRGQQATDFVAQDLLRRGGVVAPNRAPFSREADWMLYGAFVDAVPAAKPQRVSWYTLRAER